MIAKIVTGASFGGCTAYAYGKRISDSNWLKRNVRVCKELKQKYGLTFGEGKSQTRTERLRQNERTRYEMASDVKSALKDSRNWKDFSNNLKPYGIRAEIKFKSGTTIPQGISFTRNGTTFKGSSLDRNLGFSRIDKVLIGGMNIDSNGQSQNPAVHESRSPEQNQSMTSDLANIASELTIGLISSGQEKKSEEEDFAPKKKRGPKITHSQNSKPSKAYTNTCPPSTTSQRKSEQSQQDYGRSRNV